MKYTCLTCYWYSYKHRCIHPSNNGELLGECQHYEEYESNLGEEYDYCDNCDYYGNDFDDAEW